jgi:hypothetical protein
MRKLLNIIRLKLATWEADGLHNITGQQYYVLKYGGRFKVLSAKHIKQLKRRRVIKKNLDWNKLQEISLYKTV